MIEMAMTYLCSISIFYISAIGVFPAFYHCPRVQCTYDVHVKAVAERVGNRVGISRVTKEN